MKINNLVIALIGFSSLVLSCKKNDDDIAKATEKKIHNIWQIDSLVITQQVNGNASKQTHTGKADDYIDFRSDGRMITHFQGTTDNSSYAVQSDTVIIIGGDSAYILELTENKFVFFTKADAGSLGFIEITYYLRK